MAQTSTIQHNPAQCTNLWQLKSLGLIKKCSIGGAGEIDLAISFRSMTGYNDTDLGKWSISLLILVIFNVIIIKQTYVYVLIIDETWKNINLIICLLLYYNLK